MDPWNASTGMVADMPVQKFWTAGADNVPPAPWVKIRNCVADGCLDSVYKWHSIGLLANEETMVKFSKLAGAASFLVAS